MRECGKSKRRRSDRLELADDRAGLADDDRGAGWYFVRIEPQALPPDEILPSMILPPVFRRRLRFALPAAALLAALAGCQTPPPPTPQQLTATVKLPVVARLPETQEAQEKGGVEISVVPAIYVAEKTEKMTTRQVNPTMGNMVLVSLATGGNSGGKVFVQQVTEQQLRVQPNRLQFTVRINNKLPRVFRGQGAVVQFNAAGKLIPFDRVDYKEFVNGIVPPRNESEFKIMGPSLDALPDDCTLGIFLYDVVTATDLAGNVTEKQNYEWYFTYKARATEQSVERKVAEGFIDLSTFQQLLAKEQQERMMEQMRGAADARSAR